MPNKYPTQEDSFRTDHAQDRAQRDAAWKAVLLEWADQDIGKMERIEEKDAGGSKVKWGWAMWLYRK